MNLFAALSRACGPIYRLMLERRTLKEMCRAIRLCVAVAAITSLAPAYAQSGRAFEVVSIRPNREGGEASDTTTTPGRLSLINATPASLIRRAFGIQEWQIIGSPAWISTERFDIIAVTGGADQLTDKSREPFLQALLADRFGLKYHKETRELDGYSLVVAKNGPKLVQNTGAGEYAMKVTGGLGKQVLHSTKGNIPRLIEILSRVTGRMVTDDTGLSGQYDFTLEWGPDEQTDLVGPSLFTALQEQLGLRLAATKKPTEVIVIDRVDRPTDN